MHARAATPHGVVYTEGAGLWLAPWRGPNVLLAQLDVPWNTMRPRTVAWGPRGIVADGVTIPLGRGPLVLPSKRFALEHLPRGAPPERLPRGARTQLRGPDVSATAYGDEVRVHGSRAPHRVLTRVRLPCEDPAVALAWDPTGAPRVAARTPSGAVYVLEASGRVARAGAFSRGPTLQGLFWHSDRVFAAFDPHRAAAVIATPSDGASP